MPLTLEQFERAVVSYGPILRRILLKLNRGRAADADDLLQRTFQTAWEKRDVFLGGEVEPWLRGIARYEHLNHLRRLDQRRRLQDAALAEAETQAWAILPRLASDRPALRDCFGRLDDRDQRIVGLFYGRQEIAAAGADDDSTLDPLTDREIAEVLDAEGAEAWSGDRVRTRRHRALKQLRKCLAAKGAME